MVRLAQDFNTRYMLVEGQGNFGSVDGDGATAVRACQSAHAGRLAADTGEISREGS